MGIKVVDSAWEYVKEDYSKYLNDDLSIVSYYIISLSNYIMGIKVLRLSNPRVESSKTNN